MKKQTKITITAMCLVAALAIFCLYREIDSYIVLAALSIIGGLGGYELKTQLQNRQK